MEMDDALKIIEVDWCNEVFAGIYQEGEMYARVILCVEIL